MDSKIVKFISRFRGSEDTFLHGCCYWFAHILMVRFGLEVVYEPVEGHFLARGCNGKFYDIRGDVTSNYAGLEVYTLTWLKSNEPTWYKHIMRDCRDLIEPTEEGVA